MFESSLYRHLPMPGQEWLIGARGLARRLLREQQPFQRHLAELRQTQWLSGERLRAWQRERMQRVLVLARSRVPFYRDVFAGSVPEIESSQWQELPLLSKEIVAREAQRLCVEPAPRVTLRASTSGTTGTPLTVLQDFAAVRREHAFVTRQMEWAGVHPQDRRAWLRADLIVPIDHNAPPFWRRNWGERMMMFSSFHLSEANCPAYIAELERYDPHVIQGYPSTVAYLARYLETTGREYAGRNLKAIVTSSESVSPEQREVIERRFGQRVFDWYGSVERVCAIGTCEAGSYHLLSDYGFTELVDLGDRRAELVSSGFNNLVMPLIRYRTGDVVRLAPEGQACSCGRAFPVIEHIEGRAHDYLLTRDGREVRVLNHIMRGAHSVLEAQILQENREEIQVLAVANGRLADADRELIVKNARAHLGSDMRVRVQEVASIPRGPGGKFRAVVNKVREARAGVEPAGVAEKS